MISKNRKYFTLFGLLAATADITISSIYSKISQILQDSSKIVTILLTSELKPAQQYSTNNI